MIYFFASVGTFSESFFLFSYSLPYFGLACDGNSFLCLEEEEREGTIIDRDQKTT